MEKRLSFELSRLRDHSSAYKLDLATSRVIKLSSDGSTTCNRQTYDDILHPMTDELTFRAIELPSEKRTANVKACHYEGGFTIWESTWFLLSFLHQELRMKEGDLAIDLGCGNGICGIHALRNGYEVLFQDLNWEVLEESVVPNYLVNIVLRQIEADTEHAIIRNDGTERQDKHLMGDTFQQGNGECTYSNESCPKGHNADAGDVEVILNTSKCDTYCHATIIGTRGTGISSNSLKIPESTERKPILNDQRRCKYELLSCMWDNMPSYAETFLAKFRNACSLIVASECLYRTENYPAIANILLQYLMENDGRAYIATKRLYFGMDGGSFEFMTYINSKHSYSKHKLQATIHKTQMLPCSSNVIDILEVRKYNTDITEIYESGAN